MRVPALAAAATALVVSASSLVAQAPARWTLDATPILTLGESQADTNDMLSRVVGAARLPDGRIIVGDVASYALRLYTADGKLVRRFGRKGGGPGEIGYLASLFRCGDSLVTMDIDGNRTSVFSLGGEFVRMFRFSSPQTGRPPYRSACNARGDFVHYGWEARTDIKGGAYRPMVPLWISRADSVTRPAIATIPGSERFGLVVNGTVRGARPLPLGKQTAIAISNDRVYVATGERYEIVPYDFTGKPLASMREDRAATATSREDIAYHKERELALVQAAQRPRAEQAFDELPLPKVLPTYSELVIDARGHIWARDYPRGKAAASTWHVYHASGKRVATIAVPTHLEIYEIGDDYVLGRFMDPDEAVPLVRMYRLRR